MPVPDRADRASIRPVLVLIALYTIVPVLVLRPIIDVDIWWHLRQGQWIVEQATVPTTDPFSWFGVGRRWIAYHWLFEVVVYALYAIAGLAGVVGYTLGMGFAITFALHRLVRRLEPDLFVSSLLTALALTAMVPVLAHPRPWLVNILFIVLQLTILHDAQRSGDFRPLVTLPLLFVVWANVNIQFVYGLFVLGAAALEPAVEWLRGREQADAGLRLRSLLLTFGVCALATMVGPYHVTVYLPVLDAIRLTAPFEYLQELQAPRFREPFNWVALGLLLSAVFLAGRQRPLSIFHAVLLGTGAFLFFRAARDVWVCVVASVVVIAMYAPWSLPPQRVRLGPIRVGVVATVVLAVTVGFSMARLGGGRLDSAVATRFPEDAAAFVEQAGYRGQLYNDYDWGGYLIWRLPQIPVGLDGRNPLHGDDRILRSVATWGGRPGWDTDPELAASQVVIGNVTRPLVALLRLDTRFRQVYEDKIAAVFVKRDATR
jgi:hypothetical protein